MLRNLWLVSLIAAANWSVFAIGCVLDFNRLTGEELKARNIEDTDWDWMVGNIEDTDWDFIR
jgi:hypothetical protein